MLTRSRYVMAASAIVMASTLWRTCVLPGWARARDSEHARSKGRSQYRASRRLPVQRWTVNATFARWRIRGRKSSSPNRNTGKPKAVFCRRRGSSACARRTSRPISPRPYARRTRRTWSSGPRPTPERCTTRCQPGGVIARFGVGHDGIDKARATEAGLLCTNTPGVLDQSVAEHTMLLVAAAARRLVAASTSMAQRAWDPVTGEELQGKTLAIVGCGGIGRSVARIAALGYGMQVVGCSRPGVPPPGGARSTFVW